MFEAELLGEDENNGVVTIPPTRVDGDGGRLGMEYFNLNLNVLKIFQTLSTTTQSSSSWMTVIFWSVTGSSCLWTVWEMKSLFCIL